MARRTVPGTPDSFSIRWKSAFDSGVFVMISIDLNGVSPLRMIVRARSSSSRTLLSALSLARGWQDDAGTYGLDFSSPTCLASRMVVPW